MQIASIRPRWRALTLAAVLLVAGCGAAETTTDTSSGGDGASGDNPEDAAEQNIPLLATPDDVRDVEILSVTDGSITTLRGAVDGDRPVLLWFWAPH